jgi:phage shock protein C
MSTSRTGFYLDKRDKRFLGVCAGIADYFGWNVFWVRMAFVFATLFGAAFLPILYLAIGFIAGPKPARLYDDSAENRRFWTDVRVAPRRTVRNVHASFRDIDRRLRDIEAHVTSRNRSLSEEIERLR